MDKNIYPDQDADLQKQTEDKIQKSENLYRSLFDNMLEGYAYCKMIFENGTPQDFTYITVNNAFEKLTGLKNVVGKKVSEVIPGIQESDPELFQIYGRVALTGNPESFEMYLDSLGIWFSVTAYCPEKEYFIAVFDNITERKRIDSEKEITINLFRLLNADNNLHELMKGVTNLLHEWSGCEAVGIRLHDGNDFPYFETGGFPPEFIELENRLCEVDESGELVRDSEGNPVLECMCGNIIRGRVNPELPFFTEGGSYWTNSTTEFLATTSEEDRQARSRNRCNSAGYESVALVPLRSVEGCLGLFQFNDKRKGRFTKNKIELFERLASNLAIAISQRKAVRELKDTTQILETIFDSAHLQVAYLDPQFNFIMVNRAYADGAEKEIDFFTGKNNFDLFPDPDTKVVFRRVVETGQPYFAYAISFEYPNNPERGVTYWDWSLVPIKDNEENVISLVLTLDNVTERMRLEEKLMENQERYRIITDNVRDTLWLIDLNLRTTWITPSVTRTRGFTLEEIQEMPLDKQFTPESLNRVIKLYQENMSPDKLLNPEVDFIISGEFEYYRKDGSTFWADTIITLLRGINGEPTGFMCVGRDITERKQAEEKLRESEKRYRNVIAQAGGVAYQRDWQNGTYIFMDEGIKHLIGYSSDEMTPKLFTRLVNEENPGGVDKKFIQSEISQQIGGDTATLYQGEYRIKTKDSQIKFVSDSSIEFHNADGEIIQSLGMLRDITERKLSEEQLRSSEIKYRTLFNSSVDAILIHDLEGRLLEVNDAAIERLGYSREEILKMSLMDINSLDYAGLVPERIEKLIDKGYAFFETEHITKDGIKIPVEVNGKIIEYNGTPAVLGISRDITERKKAEEKLRESKERHRSILQTAIDGFWLVDTQGRLLEANDAYCLMSGYSMQELLTMSIPDLEAAETEENTDAHIQKIMAQGADRFESRHRRKDGSIFDVEISAQYRDTEGGQLVAFLRDITERKQAEVLQERLQQTSKLESIGRLAGGVAHDFNNMLTVIQGSTSLAMMDLNRSDPLYNRLKMIEDASDRATGLTRQLLAFSRKQIIEPKIINLNDIIANLQKMLGRLIGEDIELQTFLDENPTHINADPGQIEQIIINLAVNSRDAMPDGGKLTIETSNLFLDKSYCRTHPNTQVGNYVLMTISDSGYGMSKDTKEHIFEPFFTTKKPGEGTGLGLATVYGIVKQHNGHIECYSEIDHGTTFKIYLPEDDKGIISKLEESEKTDIVLGSETVLLVEDDNFVREVTTDFLKHLGYNVLIAENGGMAFIVAEQYNQTIHLLLTDIVMPGINGRQLAERLLKIHPEMKVLYTSGYTQNVIAHHGVLEEGFNFIGKPFRLQDLAKKIRDVLSQKQ
ncbi:MAG: PAS domain S-box protein [Candidatus Poribacteria bacterium]